VTYMDNARNVSIAKEMFSHKIPKAVADRIGKEKIDAIKSKLLELDKVTEAESNAPTTIEELTDEEVHGITMALTSLPFTTSDELLPMLMKAFYVQGEFDPSE